MATTDLTIYFAWVTSADTTFSNAFARVDENIFNLEIAGEEGQIPKLTIEVKNPRIGPIAPGRLHWAWLSISPDNGTTIIPMFFGRLVGIPQTILLNTVKYVFITRVPDFIRQKQRVAESLKTLPGYDRIFFDPQKRDDPDAILEGYSALYAIDRVTGEVSVSDMLIGEDGTITVPPSQTYYDSVDMKLQQSPLKAVNVKAEVTWPQRFTGFFDVGSWAYPTLGNEPFVGEWPRTGTTLGGRPDYTATIAWAGERDPTIQQSMLQSFNGGNFAINYHWQNGEAHHHTGDTMTIDITASWPSVPMTLILIKQQYTPGLIVPYDPVFGGPVDADGNPAPINQPEMDSADYFGYRTYDPGKEAVATLSLSYAANRQRSERIDMTIVADVQPILIDPLITEDTEQISLKSGDLATPMMTFLNWSSVAGMAVALGTFVFPDNPLVPGQTSSQIATTAGTAGLTEPVFSNTAGVTTADGTVVWTSLGDTPPTETAQDWLRFAHVPLGTLIMPKPISGAPNINSVQAAGALNFPPKGVPTAKYTVMAANTGGPGDTMYEATEAGILGGLALATVTLQTFTNPTGAFLYIAVQAGWTGEFHTTFNEAYGSQTTDGTVIWQNIGQPTLAIGGWPGMTPASAYFPTDRGQQSLQHLIARARAKLRRRARAVQVSFECDLLPVVDISCRKNVTMTDERLPGGGATGKVVSYKLIRDGDSGTTKAQITIGCSIGNANAITTSTDGAATYVDGVFNPGEVQVWASSLIPNPTADIGYTPPTPNAVDDGLSFPLNGVGDVIISKQWHGQVEPGAIDLTNIQIHQAVQDAVQSVHSTAQVNFDAIGGTASGSVSVPVSPWVDINAAVQTAVLQSVLQGSNLWFELVLKPLTGGPYADAYVINTTLLYLPKTLDLSAPSSGG